MNKENIVSFEEGKDTKEGDSKESPWVFEFINEWKQLFGGYNWYTMTLIRIEFEKELMAYGYEFLFVALGLGFRIRYNTEESFKQFDKWDDEIEEIV